jgi:hypothetical protein
MVLKRLKRMTNTFSSSDSPASKGDEYIEVDVGGASGPSLGRGKIGIKIESVSEFGDTERVLKHVREGSSRSSRGPCWRRTET